MRNISLDILKVFASYMVVFIHVKFIGTTGIVVTALARFAVPLFFMISGYFSYNNDLNKIKKKVFHIIKIFLCGILAYALVNIMTMEMDLKTAINEYISYYFDFKNIILLFVFHIIKSVDYLWFLLALIYCYIMYGFLHVNKKQHGWCYVVAIMLLSIHLLLGEFLSLFYISVPTYLIRNFLFMGFPFFISGIYIRENEKYIQKFFSNKKIALFILLGVLESVISVLLFGHNEIYIGTLLVAFSLFVYATKMKDIRFNKFFIMMSRCSTSIYVTHILIFRITTKLISAINVQTITTMWNYSKPIIICILSTIFALGIEVVRLSIKNKDFTLNWRILK